MDKIKVNINDLNPDPKDSIPHTDFFGVGTIGNRKGMFVKKI